ncbi:MaoC family dehydratase [Paractinoplanes lichenicola]|uniref:MaoC family dehydratase n=1 Tax=Paractinoplanes lichenicola TaxID=2802976 RepID=A0ABS1VW22_9ACTN|nr:MaoC family dehydratase [Actinoplanes lichenicola]MBL7258682.1 MaoC family dehydratase [Actinoplanes lichenicola]
MITVNGLDELKTLVGRDLGHSSWLEVTQERVNAFAEATGDHQWIHIDVDKAKDGPFKGTIAHGYLTLSLVIPFFSEILHVDGIKMGVNYGLDKVRFPSPVRVGSKIRLAATVAGVEEVASRCVQVALDFTVQIDGVDKPACVARPIYRYYA